MDFRVVGPVCAAQQCHDNVRTAQRGRTRCYEFQEGAQFQKCHLELGLLLLSQLKPEIKFKNNRKRGEWEFEEGGKGVGR